MKNHQRVVYNDYVRKIGFPGSPESLVEFINLRDNLVGITHIDGSKEMITFEDFDNMWAIVGSANDDSHVSRQQVGGTHYIDMAIDPWEVIIRNKMGFFDGNALKYIMRYKGKNGVEDLKKARHYIDKLIELEENAKR